MSLVQVAGVPEAGPPTPQEVGRFAQCQAGEDPRETPTILGSAHIHACWWPRHILRIAKTPCPSTPSPGHPAYARLLPRGFCDSESCRAPSWRLGQGQREARRAPH